ncbi:MAG: hypothetical protein LIR50_12805 [Bacillota bacterium]|nr:hypothetical protein [Bacillota bacterium]
MDINIQKFLQYKNPSIAFLEGEEEKEVVLLENLKKKGVKWDDETEIDTSKSMIPCTYLWGVKGNLLYTKQK